MRFPRPIRRPQDHYENRDERFHLTLNAHAKFADWPVAVRRATWQAVMDERRMDRIELFAACLMPDHLHLLVRPAEMNIIGFVNALKSWTTRKAWSLGVHGPIWQPGMWDRTARNEADFLEMANYIVQNPVVAGLVEDAREWPHAWVWWWRGE